MRKMLFAPLIACMVVLLSMVLMPTVSAKTLKFDQIIVVDEYAEAGPNHPDEYVYWKGTITGGITGTVYFWENWEKNYIVGKVEHFFEEFYIDLGDGWVSGYDKGVWNFATFKYRAHGFVTAASENYAGMIGNFLFEEGTTTDPNLGFPITGTGRGFMGP